MKRPVVAFGFVFLALLLGFIACVAAPTGTTSTNPGEFIDMARNTTSCAGGGSPCSSGNFGKCDPGIVTCEGKLAMCTPNNVTQDCFTGPGIVGVGICTAGQQACIGALGDCNGQIVAAAKEDCSNDLDDDCDGKVNNTCPEGLQMGPPRYVSPVAPLTPPNNANQVMLEKRCPPNSFVSRVQIQFNDPGFEVSGLIYYCSTPVLTQPNGSTNFVLTTTAVVPAPFDDFKGDGAISTGMPYDVNCAGIGLRGMVAMQGDYDTGGYIGIFLQCGSATASLSPDNTLRVTIVPTGMLNSPANGYDYGATIGYGSKPIWTCGTGEMIVGFKGIVSGSIDQLQPICAPLAPVYKL
jgi:hypothetical protein